MEYYSINHKSPNAGLKEAIVRGLASDKGLYMPERFPMLPKAFINNLKNMTLHDIAFAVINNLFGDDIEPAILKEIVHDALTFDIPLVKVKDNVYSLELFHGPTLAFKDVGARFMARLLGHFTSQDSSKTVYVLAATSGDTGSAVANGFLGVPGVKVIVLYPEGKVSQLQENQFTTLGKNITAIEVGGVFDDCQAMVKSAFVDQELNEKLLLTSANSINIARLLPQTIYYFYAVAQLAKKGHNIDNIVISVPSGNFGNITAAKIAIEMGLPVKRLIAALNANDTFLKFMNNDEYKAQPSVHTIANAMDVGDPSNFIRFYELFNRSIENMKKNVDTKSYSDDQIADTLRDTYKNEKYLLDPHGAVAYRAINEFLQPGETGIFLETAHPAKFKETVDDILGENIEIPATLKAFMNRKKQTVKMPPSFTHFKKYLLSID